jgi:hypothetical protein
MESTPGNHTVHEIFLLIIIGVIAFALIAAANGAYSPPTHIEARHQ